MPEILEDIESKPHRDDLRKSRWTMILVYIILFIALILVCIRTYRKITHT